MHRLTKLVLPAAAALVLAPAAIAQPPGGGQGGGGPQITPEMRAQFQKYRKWADANKNVVQLNRTFRRFRQLEENPKTQLTKDQARKILAVVKPWRHKPVMKDEEARKVMTQITAPLSVAQLKAFSQNDGRGGRGGGAGFGGGGGFGGGRPGGGPGGGGPGFGGGGGRPGGGGPGGFRMPDPKPYNPLNPESSPFYKADPQRGARMLQGFNEMMAKLEARAK